jgi:hypothetical protein
MMSVIMMSVIVLSLIVLIFIMLSVIMLSVAKKFFMLRVIMLSEVAASCCVCPFGFTTYCNIKELGWSLPKWST